MPYTTVDYKITTLKAADNQAIASRFAGEAIWLTSLITPQNPDVMLLYQKLTDGLGSEEERVNALWSYVANLPYKETVPSVLIAGGKRFSQKDTWFYPAETIRVRTSNCLAEGTEILVVNPYGKYEIKKIEDLRDFNGYKVLSYNFEGQKVEAKPITNWWNQGSKDTVLLRLNNGESIRCTKDHRLFQDNHRRNHFKEITPNELLDVSRPALYMIKQIPPLDSDSHISSEYLWVVGHYLAEGHTGKGRTEGGTGKGNVVICNDDPRLRQQLIGYLDELRVPHSETHLPHSNYVSVLTRHRGSRKSGPLLQERLRTLGHTAPKKALPKGFLSLNRRQLVSIMEGYSCGDSYMPRRYNIIRKFSPKHSGTTKRGTYRYKKSLFLEHSTVSDRLAQQLKLIHLILGRPLHSRYDKNSHGAGKNPLPRWVLRESRQASYWNSPLLNIGEVKVESIKPNGECPVYDIEVADNHNFMLANGMLVHNCANKSFLLASLLKNEFPASREVYCVLGYVRLDGIGAHAWVQVDSHGGYVIETTQPSLPSAFMPSGLLDKYDGIVYFDENSVYTAYDDEAVQGVINARFGFCRLEFLERYLCERCGELPSP